ncbi:hypothetical protein ACRTDU_11070 [Sunxiuqinia elliptica]
MLSKHVAKFIPFSILIIGIYSVQRYSSFPIGNTTLWWLIEALILLAFMWEVRYRRIAKEDQQAMRFVKWYLLWNVLSIVRGIFVAEIYWDYKGLTNMGMALLMPIVAYVALNKDRTQEILAFFIKYALPVALVVFIPLPIGAWGWYLFPITLLMLFFPALPLKGKVIVLLITVIAGFGDITTRSHVIKYSVPFLVVLIFHTTRHFVLSTKLIKGAQKTLMLIPLLFFVLAVSGIFEIFKMDEYIEGSYVQESKTEEGDVKEESLKADTRTFLYIEVLESAQKYNYWLIGRSPARGNETVHFADFSEEITGRPERLRNEVGVLNVFTWTGVVGVVFFFLVFFKASYMAVYRSNNIYSKLIGLYVAFRWVYAWVEDFQAFDMNSFVIWMMIGICMSSSFRKMSNAEVKLWLWGIFERKYFLKYRYYRKMELKRSI